MKEYDVAVVGGGVTGALTLRELVSRGLRCCLFEAGNDLASGASRANSAIIHAGFDPLPGTLKARLNVRGAALYPALVKALDVPYQPIPTLVAARSEAELTTVEALLDRGRQNGVPGLEKLDAAALREAEPNVSDDAVGALRAPSAIVEPWTVAVAAAENAADNGADVYLGSPVVAVEPAQTGYRLTARRRDGDFSVRADAVVNASGVRCAELHAMVAAPSFRITGRRGQYFVLDRGAAGLVRNVLFPCPTEKGKGMLIFPEIHGRVMLGPDSELTADPTDTATEAGALAVVRATVSRYLRVPLPFGLTIRTFAGVRAVGDRGDFILEEADGAPGFFDAAGIESPGLASAPATAETLTALVTDRLGRGRTVSGAFVPARRPRLTLERAAELGLPGASTIVCRCETVCEAQIVDAIRRNCGATTVKGVKLRTSSGAGGCQGGYCQPEVVAILARELGIDPSQVLYDGDGSEILTGRTRG